MSHDFKSWRTRDLLAELDRIRTLADKGSPTDDDERRLDSVIRELSSRDLHRRFEPVIDHEAKVEELKRFAADPRNVEPAVPDFNVHGRSDPWTVPASSDMLGRARTAIEQAPGGTDSARETVTQLLDRADPVARDCAPRIVAGSDPAYVSAFGKYLDRGPAAIANYSPDEAQAWQRAMAVGSNAAGGFMVPTLIDPSIVITNAGSTNPLRQIARVVQVTGPQWTGVSSAGVTASWDAEAAEVSDDSPALTQPTVEVHKAACFVPYSIEAEQDITSLIVELGRLFADAKDRLEAAAFTTGSGSGEPAGVVTRVAATTASRVAATTNNSFGLVDVYALIEALPARHRPNARWCANLSIVNDVRQFGTASNYHGFTADLVGEYPATVLGKPLHEVSDMDGTIGTGDDDILLIGDFSNLVIADRVGMSVEVVPHLLGSSRRPTGQRGLYGYWRTGSDVVNVDAFRILRV